MTTVAECFRNLIPAKRRNTRNGWTEFNCPACGDTRGRGGFLETPTGGFRFKCFNAGCDYQLQPTGYEPDGEYGLGGHTRRLFELLGGDPIDLPWAEILKRSGNPDKPDQPSEDTEVVTQFDEIPLPRSSIPLTDVSTAKGKAVLNYLWERGPRYLGAHPFYWSSAYPDHLIIPWVHDKERIVGWVGRHIYKNKGADRFIYPPEGKPADYLFNQHLIRSHAGRTLFVVEGELDAIPLGCVASRGPNLTKKQINLLRMSGKDVVMIPDRDAPQSFIKIAEAQGWKVACPKWSSLKPGEITKDVSQAVRQYGTLYTIESLMNSITDNRLTIQAFYSLNRKEK